MKYSYKTLVSLWNTRRKSNDYKPLGNNGKIYKNGDTIQYKLYDTIVATVYPDDTVEFSAGHYVAYQTTYSRMSNLFLPRGCYLASDKTKHRNKIQPVRLKRCAHSYYGNGGLAAYDHPYKDGVRIRMSDGEILNPEILVDAERVRTTDKVLSLEMRRKLAPLRKLTNVMAKIGALQKPEGYKWDYRRNIDQVIEAINFDEPTADDAQKVLEIGFVYSDIHWVERDNFPYKRVIDNGLKKVRENYYAANNGYSYETVERKAA